MSPSHCYIRVRRSVTLSREDRRLITGNKCEFHQAIMVLVVDSNIDTLFHLVVCQMLVVNIMLVIKYCWSVFLANNVVSDLKYWHFVGHL